MWRHDTDTSESNADGDERGPRWRRSTRALIVALVIGLAIASVPIAVASGAGIHPTASEGPAADGDETGTETATEPTLVVSDTAVDPKGTETHRVALTDAPDGLAGFELTLEMDSTDVATVEDASYPDRFGMTTDPAVGADGRTITVEAVDLDDEITDGASDVTLARIDVTGVDAGDTELRVSDFQIDADGGSPIEPPLEAGTVTVGESGSGTDTTASDTGSDSDTDSSSSGESDSSSTDGDDDSIPGFTVGLAIVVLAATLLAHRP